MAYEMKPNSGSLFKNDRKESDSHPDYKGQALIEGVNYWLDAWINTTNSGDKYMSLKLKPKDAPRASVGASQDYQPQCTPADFDDEIPF